VAGRTEPPCRVNEQRPKSATRATACAFRQHGPRAMGGDRAGHAEPRRGLGIKAGPTRQAGAMRLGSTNGMAQKRIVVRPVPPLLIAGRTRPPIDTSQRTATRWLTDRRLESSGDGLALVTHTSAWVEALMF
jgi:hypothetical protein